MQSPTLDEWEVHVEDLDCRHGRLLADSGVDGPDASREERDGGTPGDGRSTELERRGGDVIGGGFLDLGGYDDLDDLGDSRRDHEHVGRPVVEFVRELLGSDGERVLAGQVKSQLNTTVTLMAISSPAVPATRPNIRKFFPILTSMSTSRMVGPTNTVADVPVPEAPAP